MNNDVVIFEELAAAKGQKIGVAMLNAEKSLNALSVQMVELLRPQLEAWQQDETVMAVFLHSAGEKAFCAGGDIVAMYNGTAAYADPLPDDSCQQFFNTEYRLDYLIHNYSKPFIVLGGGIVMGGGLGLLGGANNRVVTETTRMAMPEISIGLYPDVGGTWLLNQAPDKTGLFMGLTGTHINGADSKYMNLADHFITEDLKDTVLEALTEVKCERGVLGVLQHFSALSEPRQPASNIEAHINWINEVCEGDDLLKIIDNIVAYSGDDKWCDRAAKTLARGCPITPFLVWEQLRRGADLSLAEIFQMELVMSVNSAAIGHLREGIRALLIDKDHKPKWTPSTFADVTEADVAKIFASPWAVNPLADL